MISVRKSSVGEEDKNPVRPKAESWYYTAHLKVPTEEEHTTDSGLRARKVLGGVLGLVGCRFKDKGGLGFRV